MKANFFILIILSFLLFSTPFFAQAKGGSHGKAGGSHSVSKEHSTNAQESKERRYVHRGGGHGRRNNWQDDSEDIGQPGWGNNGWSSQPGWGNNGWGDAGQNNSQTSHQNSSINPAGQTGGRGDGEIKDTNIGQGSQANNPSLNYHFNNAQNERSSYVQEPNWANKMAPSGTNNLNRP